MSTNNEILSLIRQARLAQGLSTTQLAYRLGVHQSTAVRLESSEKRGAITLQLLKRAAAALHCTLRYSFEPLKGTRSLSHNTAGKRGRGSRLSAKLRKEDIAVAKKLSGVSRIKRACQLSDFARRLSNV